MGPASSIRGPGRGTAKVTDVKRLEIRASSAISVDGDFGSFDFGFSHVAADIGADIDITVRRFHTSCLPPVFEDHVSIPNAAFPNGHFTEALLNVMHSPLTSGGDADTRYAACLGFGLGGFALPFGSLSIQTFPAPLYRSSNGFDPGHQP